MKIFNGFKRLTIFEKKLRRKCLTGLKIGVLLLRYWAYSCSKSIIKPRKHSAGKYMWHRFWKNKGSWWDSKQNECLRGSSRLKRSLKIVLGEISQDSQEIYAGISFFIKLLTLEICCLIKNKSLSSAKWRALLFLIETCKSLLKIMNNRNNSGPKMSPGGHHT